jgi:hypothetical protein
MDKNPTCSDPTPVKIEVRKIIKHTTNRMYMDLDRETEEMYQGLLDACKAVKRPPSEVLADIRETIRTLPNSACIQALNRVTGHFADGIPLPTGKPQPPAPRRRVLL